MSKYTCDELGVCQQRTPPQCCSCDCDQGRSGPARLVQTRWAAVPAKAAPIALQGPYKGASVWQRMLRALRW